MAKKNENERLLFTIENFLDVSHTLSKNEILDIFKKSFKEYDLFKRSELFFYMLENVDFKEDLFEYIIKPTTLLLNISRENIDTFLSFIDKIQVNSPESEKKEGKKYLKDFFKDEDTINFKKNIETIFKNFETHSSKLHDTKTSACYLYENNDIEKNHYFYSNKFIGIKKIQYGSLILCKTGAMLSSEFVYNNKVYTLLDFLLENEQNQIQVSNEKKNIIKKIFEKNKNKQIEFDGGTQLFFPIDESFENYDMIAPVPSCSYIPFSKNVYIPSKQSENIVVGGSNAQNVGNFASSCKGNLKIPKAFIPFIHKNKNFEYRKFLGKKRLFEKIHKKELYFLKADFLSVLTNKKRNDYLREKFFIIFDKMCKNISFFEEMNEDDYNKYTKNLSWDEKKILDSVKQNTIYKNQDFFVLMLIENISSYKNMFKYVDRDIIYKIAKEFVKMEYCYG